MANLVGKNPVFVSSSEAVAKSDAVVWIRIGEDADGQRLDNYLFRIAKGVPKSHLYRIVRAGEVRVNKKRVAVDTRLNLGDELRVPPIRVSAAPKKEVARPIDDLELPVLYEDEHILVVDKPAGLAAHGGSGVSFGLIERMRAARPNQPFLELVHRLDRDTSGLMVYAKDMETEQILEHNWHEIVYDRRYVAVVSGEVVEEGGTISSWLKDNKAYMTFSSPVDNGGKYAVTHFHTLARTTEHSLVEYRLETGRKNQIRVHSADMGHPVCGDVKYGNGDNPLGRLCLHAYVLCFYHPVTGEPMEFETIIPPAFKQLFK